MKYWLEILLSVLFLSATNVASAAADKPADAETTTPLKKECKESFTIAGVIEAIHDIDASNAHLAQLRRQNRWRENIRGAEQPVVFENNRSERFLFRQSIREGNVARAINMASAMFQRVERAFLVMEAFEQFMDPEFKDPESGLTPEEEKIWLEYAREQYLEARTVFAEEFMLYKDLRGILDRAIRKERQETNQRRQTATFINSTMEVEIIASISPFLMHSARDKRPDLAELTEKFNEDADIQFLKAEYIARKERNAGIGAMFMNLVGGRNSPIHRFLATRVPGLAKMLHDDLCLTIYFPRIETFLNLGNQKTDIAEHYKFLFQNYGTDGKAFLIAYFRYPETITYHQQLVDHAKDQKYKEDFADALEWSLKKAAKEGGLSPSRRLKSWARRVPVIATAVGIAMATAWNYWIPTAQLEPVDNTPASVLTLEPEDVPNRIIQDMSDRGVWPAVPATDTNESPVIEEIDLENEIER